MDAKFIKPTVREPKIYNLNLVYKIEKDGVDYRFHLIGGDVFTMNAGHVPKEIKESMEG